MTGSLKIERQGNVLIATIVNPPSSMLTPDIVGALLALAQQADRDSTVGGVVVTGSQAGRFIAHFDVAEILRSAESAPKLPAKVLKPMLRAAGVLLRIPKANKLARGPLSGIPDLILMMRALRVIETCSAVWVAAINGSTAGGGCEFSLACDYRFMADGEYTIAQPEIFLGFPPGGGGTQRLTRLIGAGPALRLCLEGVPLSPAEALDVGLLDRVVPEDELLRQAVEHASRIGDRPKVAIGAVKRAIRTGGSMPIDSGLLLEAAEFASAITTPDSIAAQRAYVERTRELGDVPIADPDVVAAVLENGRFV